VCLGSSLSFKEIGLPLWGAIALIAAFPVLALAFSTIPAIIDQRRITLYSQIGGSLQKGVLPGTTKYENNTFT
jgi:hypothetical protein